MPAAIPFAPQAGRGSVCAAAIRSVTHRAGRIPFAPLPSSWSGLTRPSTAPDGAWILGSSPRMTNVEDGGWQTTVDAGGWGRLSMGG